MKVFDGPRTTARVFNLGLFQNECYFSPQVVVFVTMLALPLLSILWLYMNMLLRLWRGSAATHGPGPARDTRNKCKGKENKMRVTRMIIVVIIVFTLCWTPLQVSSRPALSGFITLTPQTCMYLNKIKYFR